MNKLTLSALKKNYPVLLIATVIFLQMACMPFLQMRRNAQQQQQQQQPPTSFNNQLPTRPAALFDLRTASDIFGKDVYDLLLANDFAAIEKIATEAREKKERLPGGYWKIDSVYDALSDIYAEPGIGEVSESLWKNRIELLKNWKESSPESTTPRIALAEAHFHFAWFYRGSGYAGSVSKPNSLQFQEQINLAEKELIEAQKLEAKDPRWFRAILFLGMVKGWSPSEFEDMFETAIKSEPNYFQYYLVKSEYLTPKWHGREGDWQNYLDSLPDKLAAVKSDETDSIYFTVVVNKLRDSSMMLDWNKISKDRLENGYNKIEKSFGTDNMRLNQHAFVAFKSQNMASAKKALDRIGDDWNDNVWTEASFNMIKQVAK